MIKLPVYNIKGEKLEDFQISCAEKSLKLNKKLLSQVLRVEKNAVSFKPGKTKTRSEVAGGGRKPWKQKGTGRARAGSLRSPIFIGGGVTFGPDAETRALKIPSKMRKSALEMLLCEKSKQGEVLVLESINVEGGKTKFAAQALQNLKIANEVILVSGNKESSDLTAWLNLAQVNVVSATGLRCSDLVGKKRIIFTKQALSGRFKVSK